MDQLVSCYLSVPGNKWLCFTVIMKSSLTYKFKIYLPFVLIAFKLCCIEFLWHPSKTQVFKAFSFPMSQIPWIVTLPVDEGHFVHISVPLCYNSYHVESVRPSKWHSKLHMFSKIFLCYVLWGNLNFCMYYYI